MGGNGRTYGLLGKKNEHSCLLLHANFSPGQLLPQVNTRTGELGAKACVTADHRQEQGSWPLPRCTLEPLPLKELCF